MIGEVRHVPSDEVTRDRGVEAHGGAFVPPAGARYVRVAAHESQLMVINGRRLLRERVEQREEALVQHVLH